MGGGRGRRGGGGGGGRGGPLSALSSPSCAAEDEKVLTGKQGQSPGRSTCVSDLHAYATLTGKVGGGGANTNNSNDTKWTGPSGKHPPSLRAHTHTRLARS